MRKISKEEFLERFHKVHGDKYDYSQCEFIDSKTHVKIICPKHGEFWQVPAEHYKGKGCRKCAEEEQANRLKMDNKSFIEKAREIHGDKYDYSKVKYVNNSTKVEIVCPKHGSFWMTPKNHLGCKQGCRKCWIERNKFVKHSPKAYKDKESFIERARKVHGDKYDYSLVEYKGYATNVKIICPEHGIFEQMPTAHVTRGSGCPKCAAERLSRDHAKTTEKFILQALELHGDKFDYSRVNYINKETPVEIICPKHGSFFQKPKVHLMGSGCDCPMCAKERADEKMTKTTEEFIQQAQKTHGDRYDYSKTNYINVKNKVEIICKEHGPFLQWPTQHIDGRGCPACSYSSLEREIEVMLKENHIPFIPQANKSHLEWMGLQKLDFYLPKQKMAIECQGGQHFFPVDYFGGEKYLESIQERDDRKRRKCHDNGVRLLYFSDKQYKPNIYIDKNIILQEIKKEDAKLRTDAEGLRNVLSG